MTPISELEWKSTENYLHPDDIPKLLSFIDMMEFKVCEPRDVVFFFTMMFWCGLRVSEALKITPNDIRINDGYVKLYRTKTREEDSVLIPPELKDVIIKHLRYRERRYIPDTEPIIHCSRMTVWRWLKKLSELSGCPAMIPDISGEFCATHIFRKSVAKAMLRGDLGRPKVDIETVAYHLRHSNPNTTSAYVKIDRMTAEKYWGEEK